MAVADEVRKRPAAVQPKPQSQPQSDGAAERQRLRMMMLIRRFEERTFQEYTRPGQKIGGFCHLYSGQEAIAVGTASLLDRERDYLVTAYRCHGHSLALGMTPRAGFAELFGKVTGCSKGKGGSMHFIEAHNRNMGGHGIVGGQLPLGTGLAFAQWYKKTGGVTFCFMGDGAINQGTFNESLNLASLWKLPCIFIVENNGVAMGTLVERSSAEPNLAERASGFAMPYKNIDGNDIDLYMKDLTIAIDRGRRGEGPSYFVANTYRFRGHSMSDPLKYRTRDEMEKAKQRDPISLYQLRLREGSLITQEQLEQMEKEIAVEINEAVKQADADPFPELDDRFSDVLAETYPYEADK